MGTRFNKWWLLPFGVFIACALISSNIVIFGPFVFDGPSPETVALAAGGVAAGGVAAPAAGCSGALETDYACQQERYRNLVLGPGVEDAFTELKKDYETNEFVKSNCHQMTHVVGRAAAERYGDIPGAYAKGDSFCWSGYYHGAMETIVAKIGPEKIIEEADGVCAELADSERYSFYHYNCVHGLGHGFMSIKNNDLFAALDTCDLLSDPWESDTCYGGIFMENIAIGGDTDRPSEYVDPARPMYPCTDLAYVYKDQCYGMQTSYALKTQGNDFAKVFELCRGVEADFQPTCYKNIGRDAVGHSNNDAARIEATCRLGRGYEARSNCVIGAARTFVSYYNSNEQAKELCLSANRKYHASCLQATEDYYATF